MVRRKNKTWIGSVKVWNWHQSYQNWALPYSRKWLNWRKEAVFTV